MYEITKDTFVEQLVKIEPTTKTKATVIAIWTVFILMAIGLIAYCFINPSLSFVFIILAALCVYLAFNMSSKLNIEYEYINTNGEIDIDCVISKKKRQNMANFSCTDIESIEKYNPNKHIVKKENNNLYFACIPDDASIVLKIKRHDRGYFFVVMSPNEDFRESLKKYLPYLLKKEL